MTPPKIFLYLTDDTPGFNAVVALAEDGTGLASHLSSNSQWARTDIMAKKRLFDEHYPQGYELVDLIDTLPESYAENESLLHAIHLNRTYQAPNDSPE